MRIETHSKYYLIPIDDNKQKIKVISMFFKHNIPLYLWLKEQTRGSGDEFIITDCQFEKEYPILTLKKNKPLLKSLAISPMIGKEVFLSAKFQGKHYVSSAILKFIVKKNTYSIKFKNKLFLSIQRENIRFKARKECPIIISIDGEIFTGTDFSASGIAIIIDEEQKNMFPKDKIFSSCTLEFENTFFPIPRMTVKNTQKRKIDDELKYSIGMQFNGLSSESDIKLCQIINNAIKKYDRS